MLRILNELGELGQNPIFVTAGMSWQYGEPRDESTFDTGKQRG